MDEIMEITDFIQDAAGQSAEVIWGYGVDEKLDEDLCVTVIATGFKHKTNWKHRPNPGPRCSPWKKSPRKSKHPFSPPNIRKPLRLRALRGGNAIHQAS